MQLLSNPVECEVDKDAICAAIVIDSASTVVFPDSCSV